MIASSNLNETCTGFSRCYLMSTQPGAARSPGPKPKRQSVPDYEFPAPSGANPLSTPMKKPAAKKKTQPAKNRIKNTAANSSSQQEENGKQTNSKRLEMSDSNLQINFDAP